MVLCIKVNHECETFSHSLNEFSRAAAAAAGAGHAAIAGWPADNKLCRCPCVLGTPVHLCRLPSCRTQHMSDVNDVAAAAASQCDFSSHYHNNNNITGSSPFGRRSFAITEDNKKQHFFCLRGYPWCCKAEMWSQCQASALSSERPLHSLTLYICC